MIKNGLAKSLNPWYITVGLLAATSILTFTKIAFASEQCYGSYGNVITCPIKNKSFSVEKFVKVNDTWQNNLTKVEDGTEVQFLIHIENTGEVTSKLIIKDTLPTQLSLVKVVDSHNASVTTTVTDRVVEWETIELQPNKTVNYYVTTKANTNNITPGTEVCGIENVATIYRKGIIEGRDSAFICAQKGKVKSQQITTLPETAASSSTNLIGLGVVNVLGGLLVLSIIKIIEELKTK